jgi:hypothetical protein
MVMDALATAADALESLSFEALTSWPNLLCAYRKAAKGKRGKPDVAAYEARLEDNLINLQSALRQESWRPGGYDSFLIHEPKRRVISAAPFADRVVHHALCSLLEPAFERGFVADSYANRIGKGNHRALDAAQGFARRWPYVLQLDVQRFFPSIDHAILRMVLARRVVDGRLLRLMDLILASGDGVLHEEADCAFFPGDDLLAHCRPRGLPIGNLTSQFWANVYLNALDHCIKRELRCPGYVRYVDDLLLFGDDKAVMTCWRDRLVERLGGLRLRFHPGAHPRPVTEGFGFLGFRVFPDRRRLKRRKHLHFRQHLGALLEELAAGRVHADAVVDSVLAWNNHAGYGNTLGLRKDVFRMLPPEVAADARARYLRSPKGKQLVRGLIRRRILEYFRQLKAAHDG